MDTDRTQRRDGPVQSEKEEEDPFGLDKFLTAAKEGKRPLDEPSRSRYAYHILVSFECRKVNGFVALLRCTIALKTPPFFHPIRNKTQEPIVTCLHVFSRASRALHVFTSSRY